MRNRPSWWIPYAVLILSLLLTYSAARYVAQSAADEDQIRFDNAIENARDAIAQRSDTYNALLRSTAALIATDSNLSSQNFTKFVDRLQLSSSYPGIGAIGFARRVEVARREEFLQWARAAISPGFAISPPGDRDEYVVVSYLDPITDRNRPALGYDMFSDPTRREAMTRALAGGTRATSGKIYLRVNEPGVVGFLSYVPVYPVAASDKAKMNPSSPSAIGYVYAAHRATDFFNTLLDSDLEKEVSIKVFDGRRADPGALLFSSSRHAAVPRISRQFTTDFGGRSWTIVCSSLPEFSRGSDVRHLPFVITGGLLVSLLLFGVSRAQIQTRAAAEDVALDLLASQTALQDREERFRLAARATNDAIWDWDLLTNHLWWSDSIYALSGYQPGEVPFRIDWWEQQLHEEDRGRVMAEIQEVVGGKGDSWSAEYRFRRKDGSYAHVLDRGYLARDADGKGVRMLGAMQDITSRKLVQEALTYQSQVTRTITDNAASCLILMNSSGHPTFMNPAAEEVTGFRLEEIKRQHFHEFLHHKKPDGVPYPISECPIDAAVVAMTQLRNQEEVFIRKNGEFFPISYSVAPIRGEGNTRGAVIEFRDITEEKAAERDLREAHRRKDEFLATLSHELRTPMTSILGWSKLLIRDELEPELTKDAIETIHRSAQAQAHLIDDILDVSQITTGNMRLEVESISILPVLVEAIQTVQAAAHAKEIRIERRFDPTLPDILADAHRLQQVFWNILMNAIKFTPRGGLVIVEALRGESSVCARITDSGPGIGPKFLPYVFDRFRQEETTRTRTHGGLGLGLAIARHLTELHGGTIRAESEGQGAVFTVELPLRSG